MHTSRNNPTSSLESKDKKYTWHPFTQMKDWEQEEVVIIKKGDGSYLEDIHGNRYIDGVSSLWTNVHGHKRKELDDAIREQLDEVAHSTFLGLSNVPAIELAEKLIAVAPKGLARVFYADSGSEAMEVSLKVAYQYHCQKKDPEPERTKFIHLTQSYHGDTIGAVSVGGIDLFHKIYRPLIFDTVSVPTPYCYRCPFDAERDSCSLQCLKALESVMQEHSNEIAAIVIEPVMQGAAGMIKQPKGYLSRVRELADEHNVLLICDEVATGFGRTGSLFACDIEGVSPDIMSLGKGLTGGYLPLSATLFTEEIFQAFLGEYEEFKSFFHGHTYTGNQLSARVACANLDIFEHDKTVERLQPTIAYLTERLEKFKELKHVGDIRQAGCMVGIELVISKETKEPYSAQAQIGHKVVLEARKRGILIRPLGGVVVLMPPLSISLEVLDLLLSGVYESIKSVTE